MEKYDPKLDPKVWIDTYLMEMGIVGDNEPVVTRYLPLVMEGATRQWINTLPADSIDS